MMARSFALSLAFGIGVLLAPAVGWSQSPPLRGTPAPPVALPPELLDDQSEAESPGTAKRERSAIVLREASPAESETSPQTGGAAASAPESANTASTDTASLDNASPDTASLDKPVRSARRAAAAAEPTAEPAAAETPSSAGEKPTVLRPFKLRGITPGDSTAAELTAAWGEPLQEKQEDGATLWRYELDPFPVVTATIRNDLVEHVLIQLPQPQDVRSLVVQMQIDEIRPGRVDDADGQTLGLVFPERGVAIAVLPPKQAAAASAAAIGDLQAAYIVIEPISAEPFVRRAETDPLGPCEANLRDLEQAVRLDPHDAYTRYALAQFLHGLGRYDDALRAATTATQLDAGSWPYKLLRAEILGELGQLEPAGEILTAVQQAAETTKLEQAEAIALAAELASRSTTADFGKTVQQRQQAIALAEPFMVSEIAAERRGAKRLLMAAHLGIARDVARGNFKDKQTVVPQWVTRGANFAEDLIRNEYGDELLRIEVARQAMAALQPIGGEIDPVKAVERTQQNAERLMAATEDPLRQAWVQWNLGLVLHDAMRIQYERRKIDDAVKFGELAIEMLEQGSRMRQPTDRDGVRLGQLYFQRGAIEAVFNRNHKQAVAWFDKAVPLLDEAGADAPVEDVGRHGESFVSMGVSYWSVGGRDQALLLTQRGLRFMEQSVEQGGLPETALSVPYTNLAAMHRQLGDDAKAADFGRMAEKHRAAARR